MSVCLSACAYHQKSIQSDCKWAAFCTMTCRTFAVLDRVMARVWELMATNVMRQHDRTQNWVSDLNRNEMPEHSIRVVHVCRECLARAHCSLAWRGWVLPTFLFVGTLRDRVSDGRACDMQAIACGSWSVRSIFRFNVICVMLLECLAKFPSNVQV